MSLKHTKTESQNSSSNSITFLKYPVCYSVRILQWLHQLVRRWVDPDQERQETIGESVAVYMLVSWMESILTINQGSYKDESILVLWKLFTLILNCFSFFSFSGWSSCDNSCIFSKLFASWETLPINSLPDVRHMVPLRFSKVCLISTLCFCTKSFWMFLSLISIFSESFCLCLNC